MSILPIQAQGSTSSPSSDSISPNRNSNHGSSLSSQFQSMPFSASPQSPLAHSGVLAPAAEDSGGSSRKVNDLRVQNGRNNFSRKNGKINHHPGSGCAQSKGKLSETSPSPRGHQSNSPANSQGGIAQSYGRRAQTMNANHLLNFHYDPIARPQPRTPPPRRQQKIKPYNRDLFLQANYKFVLLDTGNHAPELVDPDKMLRWEDVICVRYSTPVPVQCPICLEHPLCPQITSCGHIFCFPCILQYLLMGKEDHMGTCFKRCPLCFVMISQKELYTIDIENVNQYSVGDTIDFMLLTRQKDSFTPSQKNSEVDMYDPFSKFTFTSDLELSVRKAISDLDSWLAKADSGLVDDLEKLPYICAAMDQLKQRKKYWNEQGMCANGRIYKDTTSQRKVQAILSTTNVICAYHDGSSCRCLRQSLDSKDEEKGLDRVKLNLVEPLEGQEPNLPSPYDESKSPQKIANGSRDVKTNDAYNFYQAVDGQHLILHPLNMKCLLHHYGSYDMLPHRISGKILQLETVTQTEAIRRRYRYLSHFSLTTTFQAYFKLLIFLYSVSIFFNHYTDSPCTFQLCEIDLNEVLPPDSLFPFLDEIKKREKQRKQLAKKKDTIKAEVADAAYSLPVLSSWGHSSHNSFKFSMDDFEALGGNAAMSSSPPLVGERILFSNVARLGFAAAPDSPALKVEEDSASNSNKVTNSPSGASGAPTFANVTSRVKSVENLEPPKINETGKKGKKASRVLMSTAGGRRY